MNMLVHKLIFFCWLVATCFGETASPVTESSSNEPPTSPMDSNTQKSQDTQPTEATASPGPEGSSAPIATTGANPTTPAPGPTTEKPQPTNAPTETTGSPGPEGSSAPIATTGANPASPAPGPTTEKPQPTNAPTETTGSPGPEGSSAPIATTGANPATPAPGPTTEKPQPTNAPTEGTASPGPEGSSAPIATTGANPATPAPGPTTEKPQPTNAPTETTASPGPEGSSAPIATTVANTFTPASQPTPTTAGNEPPGTSRGTPSTSPKPEACSSNPCPFDSTCIELSEGFTCQCRPGSFFSDGTCRTAKVFAGNLRLTELTFELGMENTESTIFQETAKNIIAALKVALGDNPTYIESKVQQLRSGSVVAIVDNIYQRISNITQESFETTLNTSIVHCGANCGILAGAVFTEIKLCQRTPAPCDEDKTSCNSSDGIVTCPCIPGYITTSFSDRSCFACPNGKKAVNNECVPCRFGYSGFQCTDSALLAVVVISCVLGGLLLILVLAFIIYGSRTKKKDYNSPYPPAQETRTTWSNDHVPKIPRASANINATTWDTSHLEMTESGSTRALVGKERPGNGAMGSYDDLRTFTGRNQSRYSYLVQGQDNPQFIADDGRGTK